MDPTVRGFLELLMDGIIARLPEIVKPLFDPKRKAELHIQNTDDFYVWSGTFFMAFTLSYGRYPNNQEISELGSIIFRRMAEIREAIFKAG